MGDIMIGTCSWTDPTLIECGRFYPRLSLSAEARLRYYASQFPVVEVDSSYYALPGETTSGLWVTRTGTNFIFDIKAFRLFTQHPTPPSSLPQDIRTALPSRIRDKNSLYHYDLPRDVLQEIWRRFRQAMLPLDSAGKLGVVLFQFPPWFCYGEGQCAYILSCQQNLPQYTIAVEFRHNSWFDQVNMEHTLSFLRRHNLPLVCVDEPQGFSSSVPPLAEATSDIALVRFHGRNHEAWDKKGIGAAERFNYLYSEEELAEWVDRIRYLATKTRQLHILFNNCQQDKAVVNASQMRLMLESYYDE
ncbi:MAG: DUF72 domain-containing protein [Dehalococcoidales bacterium]|nr:DUF72 domain-containing protein [Dehalococcoidales bacterium]